MKGCIYYFLYLFIYLIIYDYKKMKGHYTELNQTIK